MFENSIGFMGYGLGFRIYGHGHDDACLRKGDLSVLQLQVQSTPSNVRIKSQNLLSFCSGINQRRQAVFLLYVMKTGKPKKESKVHFEVI